MEATTVIKAFGALAHQHRLAIYRLLVERGPEGLPAGVIAEKLGVAPSSLTFHVQALERAGLVTQTRNSRQMIYAADFAAMNALIMYLTKNCCTQGEGTCVTACVPTPKAKPRKRGATHETISRSRQR